LGACGDQELERPSSTLRMSYRSENSHVLRLIARGMDNADIAAALNISPPAAKNHVSSILTELGVPNRVQAATYAVRRGLDRDKLACSRTRTPVTNHPTEGLRRRRLPH
jgi:DNA-binding NarL/FixJ family response regulator